MRVLTKAYVEAKGAQIHYAAAGTSGPVLVLLHETPRSWTAFGPALPHLSAFSRVIALDTPGYGGSDALPDGATFDEYADTVAEAVDQLVDGPCWLAGVHTGAGLALNILQRNRLRVEGMILTGLPLYGIAGAAPGLEKVAPEIPFASDGAHLPQIAAYLRQKWGTAYSPSALHDACGALMDCFDRYGAGYAAIFRHIPGNLKDVICPTLFIVCEHDVLRDHDVAAARLISQSEIVWAYGIGRDLPWSAPRWYADAIHTFLARHAAGKAMRRSRAPPRRTSKHRQRLLHTIRGT
jgi:pimeloyl-ACP methyl ester carboxylesterase